MQSVVCQVFQIPLTLTLIDITRVDCQQIKPKTENYYLSLLMILKVYTCDKVLQAASIGSANDDFARSRILRQQVSR